VIKLHPDWPEAELPAEDGGGYYALPVPIHDLAEALTGKHGDHKSATPIPGPVAQQIRIGQVTQVVRYYVAHNGEVWTPASSGGTELELIVVGRDSLGRWFSVEAGNDYTGWGCQDGSDVRIGATEDQVVKFGLTESGRERLGYPKAGAL
jgi:hypothetical protein